MNDESNGLRKLNSECSYIYELWNIKFKILNFTALKITKYKIQILRNYVQTMERSS